jgi:cysteine desulfuration protein SufE
MSLADKQRDLLAELARLRDPQERLSWLVEQARARKPLPAELRTEDRRVHGCTARLWLACEAGDGVCRFRCDSDSLIVKAVAGLLCDFYSDAAAADIAATPPDFLAMVGVDHHLTPNRRNALSGVWERIRNFAAAELRAGSP